MNGELGSQWQGDRDMCVKTGSRFDYSSTSDCLKDGGTRVKGIFAGMGNFNLTGGIQTALVRACNNRTDGKDIYFTYAKWQDHNWLSQGWWAASRST